MSSSLPKSGFVCLIFTGTVIFLFLCIQLYHFSLSSNYLIISYNPPHAINNNINSTSTSIQYIPKPNYEVLAKAKRISGGNSTKFDLCQIFNSDILERGKFQKKQINKFCSSSSAAPTNYSSLFHNLPSHSSEILYNPNHQLLVCTGGNKQFHSLLESLGSEVKSLKFKSLRSLSKRVALRKFRSYYTFAFVQNPVEIIVEEYLHHLETDKSGLSFEEFLRSNFLDLPSERWKRRFASIYYLCHPCQIEYELYVSSRTIGYDLQAILTLNGGMVGEILSKVSQLFEVDWMRYYSGLSTKVKRKLLAKLSHELDYYYSLYPEKDIRTLLSAATNQ